LQPALTARTTIAMHWCENFRGAKSRLSSPGSPSWSIPLVKDLIAYLRLIAKPYDDIAAARVLARPAWRLTPPELVRFAQRARKNRKKIYDELQTKQASLPFEPSANELSDLLDFLSAQRKTIHHRTAAEILGELLEWLEIYARASEQDRAYVKRLPEFVNAWNRRASDAAACPEFRRISRVFRPGRRHHCAGRGCAGRRRAIDDRSRRQRPGVFTRVRASREQKQVPAAGAFPRVLNPRPAHEGKALPKAISPFRKSAACTTWR